MSRNQAAEISKAITILNRKRQSLLKITNAKDFTLDDAQSMAVCFTLQGLNIAAAQLEQMRSRYA